MSGEYIITREISPLPDRAEDAHKGSVGRLVVIGGCSGEVMMAGAPGLTAAAAFRSGIGLVQILVPEPIRGTVATLAPHATLRSLPTDADGLLSAIEAFRADVVAIGPGLGDSLDGAVVADLVARLGGSVVIDADGLNRVSELSSCDMPDAHRVVLTPHVGEARRLLAARGINREIDTTPASRRAAACALHEAYGCTIVLKGHDTVVTNGDRLYTNETGNPGLASGGTGDVLTGVIAALIGQNLEPFEAAILGVYLHGLAGDFAVEELGRWSVTALDVIDYLPEAFCEHAIVDPE